MGLCFNLHVADLHFLVFLAVLALLGHRLAGVGGGHGLAVHADFVGLFVAVAVADQHPASAGLVGEHDVHGIAVLDDAIAFGTAGLATDGLGLGLFLFLGERAG